MNIKFHKTVVKDAKKGPGTRVPHIVQSVVGKDPTMVEEKINRARAFLEARGIEMVRGVYGAPIQQS